MKVEMSNIAELIERYVAAGMICTFMLVSVFGTAARAETGGKEIARVDRAATPTEPGKYPSEMFVPGDGAFDGSYTSAGIDPKTGSSPSLSGRVAPASSRPMPIRMTNTVSCSRGI